MSTLTASTKLKMNKDTFFLPDSNGGVYFRNNSSSFRMQGNGIYEWIEKLMPMFNGEHTLEELTSGLPSLIKIEFLNLENFCTKMVLYVM